MALVIGNRIEHRERPFTAAFAPAECGCRHTGQA
jgi:hypothetical protein